jgi:hypothetical protein
MELPQLPDSTPKLLVSIGIILMAYFYNSENTNKALLQDIYDKQHLSQKEIAVDKVRWKLMNEKINDDIEVLRLDLDSRREKGSGHIISDQEDANMLDLEAEELNHKARSRDSLDFETQLKEAANNADKVYFENRISLIEGEIGFCRKLEIFGLFLFAVGIYCWRETEK